MGRIVLESQLLADSHHRQVSLRRPLFPLTGAALAKCSLKCGVVRLINFEFAHESLREVRFQCCYGNPAFADLIHAIERRAATKYASTICQSGLHWRAQVFGAVVKRNHGAAGLSRARKMEQQSERLAHTAFRAGEIDKKS